MSQKVSAWAKRLHDELTQILQQPDSPARQQQLEAWRQQLRAMAKQER